MQTMQTGPVLRFDNGDKSSLDKSNQEMDLRTDLPSPFNSVGSCTGDAALQCIVLLATCDAPFTASAVVRFLRVRTSLAVRWGDVKPGSPTHFQASWII